MKRPLGYCFVGWIFGESMSLLFRPRQAWMIASILTIMGSFFLFVFPVTRQDRSKILSYNGKKCKNKKKKQMYFLILFYSFSLFAIWRLEAEKNLPPFYEEVKKAGQISVVLDGKIVEQKKTADKTSVVLDDVFLLGEREGGKRGAKEGSREKREKLKKKVIVYDADCAYFIGQRMEIAGKFSLPKEPTNPGEFHSPLYYRARGIYGSVFCEQVREVYGGYQPVLEIARRIRVNLEKIYGQLFLEEEAGIVSAILLGEKTALSDDIKTLYQDSGISHILAISGLHISFFGRNLYKCLRKRRISFFTCAFFSASFLMFYGYVAGFSHSMTRATVMLLFTFLADVIGRSYDLLSAVYAAALFLLIREPYSLLDASFLLSFGAVFGIGILYPILQKIQEGSEFLKKPMGKTVVESFLISISIQIVTLPILLSFYYEVSTYSIFLNFIILPSLSYLLPLALLAGIGGSFSLVLGKIFAFFVTVLLTFYKVLARFSQSLPFAKWTIGKMRVQALLFYIVGVSLFFFCLYSKFYMEREKEAEEGENVREKREEIRQGKEKKKIRWLRKIAAVSYFIVLSIFIVVSVVQKKSEMKLIMLDVGQGDGMLIKLPDGTNCMIDGGSSSKKKIGTYLLLPALKYYGMGYLDYVFVSHEDNDHVLGIIELFEKGYSIKNLVLPYREKEEKEKNYVTLQNLAAKAKTNILFLKEGDTLKKKEFSISCLHPKKERQEGDVNADSMVLSFQYHKFRALFTGDLADGGEETLVKRLREKKEEPYTLLKVAHHGSKKSTFEPLLELVRPRLSLISCSATNIYGHPGEETIKRLEKVGSKVWITKDVGAIEISISKKGKISYTMFGR